MQYAIELYYDKKTEKQLLIYLKKSLMKKLVRST